MTGVQLIQDLDSAAALLSRPRLRILEELAAPDSASGVARRMGLPRQQVNYHLRELEKAGLIEFIEERRKGNCTERIVRATASSYLISPEALGKLGATPEERRDRFSLGYLLGLAAHAIRDLGILRHRAIASGKRIATLALETEIRFASPGERNAFAEELTNTIATLAAKYHAPEGRAFRVIAGAYPVLLEESNVEKVRN